MLRPRGVAVNKLGSAMHLAVILSGAARHIAFPRFVRARAEVEARLPARQGLSSVSRLRTRRFKEGFFV
ncbi:MAG TPA: hypothetical protein VEJ38_09820 [Candidatus Acidoferrales bacterium]|nr:hypothetical protein [Candidatus Acidoferrales bacterium]